MLARVPSSFIIISVLFITLTCNLPEWCDKTKLSNLLLPRKSGTIKSHAFLNHPIKAHEPIASSLLTVRPPL